MIAITSLPVMGTKRGQRGHSTSRRIGELSRPYQQLMETSKAIIRRFGAGSSENLRDANSFFIDIAEIWENYIQAILTKYLPSDYRVVSPNESDAFVHRTLRGNDSGVLGQAV
jgi:5-methylcytosine-specific restriction endonuclease McrBC regulatory subunit McrC